MTGDTLAGFDRSLTDRGVSSSRTTVADFDDALADLLVDPAVGTPLPIDGVSLADLPVETEPTAGDLRAATTGVTPVGLGVAEYGSLVVQSRSGGDEPVALYPERHVAVLRASDVVPDMDAAFEWLGDEFDAGRTTNVFATGPSATADMGELVEGVHGPTEVHALVVTDR